ncbi:hypothetical protein J4421_05200 [Candidatus Woesearchaeota archaeon]|nr:hypothetical protein [Candidatus Woesearchaeota archaeon]
MQRINFTKKHYKFAVHDQKEPRQAHNSDEIIPLYGNAKWAVVDILNEQYSHLLISPIDLYNWLHYNENDEVSYFLNEAGSNALSHSQFKVPAKFHLWQGTKGFVIAIEQKGKGFNAKEVDQKRIKDNEGAAFNFFRKCKNKIFFDEPEDARVVYMEFLF